MIISFDLDDTLISKTHFPLEKQNWLQRFLKIEGVRFGTKALFKALRSNNHHIYIYTTSYRSRFKIWLMFYTYGIPVDCIINQQLHIQRVLKKGKYISKFPLEFGIDIHIDDALGVKIEGDRHGFQTIIIAPDDEQWQATILNRIAIASFVSKND